MEFVQHILFKFTWMLEDFPFVRGHHVHIGIEKAVYNSAQTVVFLPCLILLFELLPTNAAGCLPSDAYMNQNPQKGLEIMHGIMENIIFMIKVPLARQNFTTGVWWGTLEVH